MDKKKCKICNKADENTLCSICDERFCDFCLENDHENCVSIKKN